MLRQLLRRTMASEPLASKAKEERLIQIIRGDAMALPFGDDTIHACVTDPPYGLHFMGAAWDTFGSGTGRRALDTEGARPGSMNAGAYDHRRNREFQAAMAEAFGEVWRVLKPGGHALVFGGPRTFHRMTCGLEDAGFEIRDALCWLFGQGFPKSHNLHGEWEGWGTALKPGWEPIVVARKPFRGTVADNVAKHGTGALNIDGCRLDGGKRHPGNYTEHVPDPAVYGSYAARDHGIFDSTIGRWPANVALDEAAATMLDEQSGHLHGPGNKNSSPRRNENGVVYPGVGNVGDRINSLSDSEGGGASRFFYCAKARRREREAGLREAGLREVDRMTLGDFPNDPGKGGPGMSPGVVNNHPTVKPLSLMRWLVRLVTPPGGIVLDPFAGSGTTLCAAALEGFSAIGIEQHDRYCEIAKARAVYWQRVAQRQTSQQALL